MRLLVTFAGLAMLSVSANALESTEPAPLVNDYPTQARVEYVIGCMRVYGGETYDHLYQCVCAIDRTASQLPYEKYQHNMTLMSMADAPGERANEVRDAARGKKITNNFLTFLDDNEAYCGLKHPKQ